MKFIITNGLVVCKNQTKTTNMRMKQDAFLVTYWKDTLTKISNIRIKQDPFLLTLWKDTLMPWKSEISNHNPTGPLQQNN